MSDFEFVVDVFFFWATEFVVDVFKASLSNGPWCDWRSNPVARTRMGGVFGRGGQGVKEVEGIGFRKQNWGEKVG